MFHPEIHINHKMYNAAGIMNWHMDCKEDFVKPGLDFIMQLMDPSDAPVEFKTSGTTGFPKTIYFRKQQIEHSALGTCQYFELNEDSTLLLCLPAELVAGRMMIARAMAVNAKLIWVKPSLNPLENEMSIHFAAFTPAQVSVILSHPESTKLFQRISKVIIGGGEISKELEDRLIALHSNVYATYGMTETLSHVAIRKMGNIHYQALNPNITFTIRSNSCLNIHCPFIQTESIETNDVVELLDSSTFRYIGRADNMINSGGIKISAEELERVILSHRLLPEGSFYITAGKDEIFGEVPVLVTTNKTLDSSSLLSAINGMLNKYQLVKRIIFIDKFEYTASGKLIRNRIYD